MNLFGMDSALYGELAVYAERAGLDTLWLSDHLLTPESYAAEWPLRYPIGAPSTDDELRGSNPSHTDRGWESP